MVDDNATNRRILEELLHNWGLQPQVVSNARDALQQAKLASQQEKPFELVISDVNMPETDGFEFVQSLRHDSQLSATTVILLTSGMRSGDLPRCEQLGVETHLMKPVKQSELLDAISLAFGGTANTVDEASASQTHEMTRSQRLNVLVAEDGIVNQKLAIGLLEKWGHSVTIAENGIKAVELSAAPEFDLILMDVEMPEMDGFQATRAIRLREQGTSTHMPIIAMTAHAMKGDAEHCLDAGMDAYVSKPIRQQTLHDAIAKLL